MAAGIYCLAKFKYWPVALLVLWTLIVIWAMSGRTISGYKPKEDSLYKALEREITNRFELVYTERFEEEQNSYKKSLEQISTDVSKLKLFLDDEDRRKRDLPTFDAPVKPNPEIIKESFRLNGPYSDDRRPFKDAVIDVARILQSIGVRAFLKGGSFLGWYRDGTTAGSDIDFGILRGDWDSEAIISAMSEAGWRSGLVHGNFSNDGFEIRFVKKMKSDDYEKTVWGDLFLYDKWEFKEPETDEIGHAYTYGFWTKPDSHYRGRITGLFDFVPACYDGHEDVIFYVPFPMEPWLDQQIKGNGPRKWMERIEKNTGPKGLISPKKWEENYPPQYLMLPDSKGKYVTNFK